MNLFFKTTVGITENFLKKNHNDYYNIIMKYVQEENISISERIYLYQNNMFEKPYCKNCNNKVKFRKFYKGYNKFCSKTCSAVFTHKDNDIKKKRIEKMLSINLDPVEKSILTKKSNNTKLSFSDENKRVINNKRMLTNIEKYGVDNVSKHNEFKNKILLNSKKNISEIRLKKTINIINNCNCSFLTIINGDYNILCLKCNKEFIIKKYLFNQRRRFNKTICLHCNKLCGKSEFQNHVYNHIVENYKGIVINGFKKFKKYEIDVFLPELNIGFECNGIYWHSDIYRDENYHYDKILFFKKYNIQIINIWEDDWIYKNNIIKSRISHRIFNTEKAIYARKCNIDYLGLKDFKDIKDFLILNNLDVYCESNITLGLKYQGELVGIMTFNEINLKKYELLRFCSKLKINIVGGFSKLLKNFVKNFDPTVIIICCDNSYNDENFYQENGFIMDENIKPFFNVFDKNSLIKKFDFELENEKCLKVWNCGFSLYKKTFK